MTQKPSWIALTIAAATLIFMGQGTARADSIVPEPVLSELMVEAQWHRSEQDDARDAVRSGRVVSPGQAKQAALAHYPGRFLDMSLSGQAYYVKIMTSGSRVVVVTVDAASGRVMGAR